MCVGWGGKRGPGECDTGEVSERDRRSDEMRATCLFGQLEGGIGFGGEEVEGGGDTWLGWWPLAASQAVTRATGDCGRGADYLSLYLSIGGAATAVLWPPPGLTEIWDSIQFDSIRFNSVAIRRPASVPRCTVPGPRYTVPRAARRLRGLRPVFAVRIQVTPQPASHQSGLPSHQSSDHRRGPSS